MSYFDANIDIKLMLIDQLCECQWHPYCKCYYNLNNKCYEWPIFLVSVGVMYGTTSIMVGHPFDTIKTKMQAQKGFESTGMVQTFAKTLRTQGIVGLYRYIWIHRTIQIWNWNQIIAPFIKLGAIATYVQSIYMIYWPLWGRWPCIYLLRHYITMI